jgi:phosphoribosyl 1,2-cyclic phosphate phosphodiesterase
MAPPIKVTFLGTGTSQGVPMIACNCEVCTSSDLKDKRLRSSILIETAKTRIIIDSGPDFRQQLLREKIKRLDAVVFTHEHKDHIAGLDEVKAFNFLNKMRMPVYATEYVNKALHREFEYIFAESKYPGIPQIDVFDVDNEPFTIGDITLEPINVLHYQLPVKGFRVNNFAYITDANFISESEKQKLKHLDVLVLNALRREPHVSHFTLDEAVLLAKELKPRKVYFTHISHQLGLHNVVNKELPTNMELAMDGLQIIVF